MAGTFTFSIIKPDAVAAGNMGAILAQIQEAGFVPRATRLVWLSQREAEAFYAVHAERPFFGELVAFMTSGPCMVLALEYAKGDAVAAFRKLIGATNPAEAEEGTIRKRFATNIQNNAVHGSDSDENALREIRFFFSESQVFAPLTQA